MKKMKNWFTIAVRGTVFVYLPVVLLLYSIYSTILDINSRVHWFFIALYLAVFLRWTIEKYRHKSIEEEVQSFDGLDKLIEQGRWQVVDKDQNRMTVRPTFDVLFNRIINDPVVLQYSNQSVTIDGPIHYITILAKNIRGEESFWTRKIAGSFKFILVGLLILMPIAVETNMVWSMNVMRHNTFANVSEEVEIDSEDFRGNSLGNAMNYGHAVENEAYIFYVEDNLNLVRRDKQFNNKEYLIQREGGTGISHLNSVGDWVYFTRGESLERMRVDGSGRSTIYSLGYMTDLQIVGNWIYFLSWEDESSLYRMDLNGQNLKQLLDVEAESFSIHENRLLVSHRKEGQPVVESYDLNGENPQIVLNTVARDLMIWNDNYYYIGEDSKLYRSEVGGESEPEVIVDAAVSSYLPTEQGIFYSLHAIDVGYPGEGVYKTTFDGSERTKLSDLRSIEGFARVGESVLFSARAGYGESEVRRLNPETGTIEVLD